MSMLLAYSMPQTNVGLYAPGGAWLSSDAGAAMVDGKPARASRFRWRSDPGFVALYADFAATKARVVALLGVKGAPVGAKTEAVLWQAGLVGPTIIAGTLVRLPDGTCASIFVFPENVPAAVRAEVRIVNDLAGASWATAATQVDVGELVVMPAISIRIDAGWSIPMVDPSTHQETRGMQISTDPLRPYRRLPVTLSMDTEIRVRGGGLANGMDWEQLRYALARGGRCLAIPRWEVTGSPGVVDTVKVHRTAIYGYADSIGEIQHVRGPFWRMALGFREIPAAL